MPPQAEPLPPSPADGMLLLKLIDQAAGCTVRTVARSYAGRPWEAAASDGRVAPDCTDGACTVELPLAEYGTLRVDAVVPPAGAGPAVRLQPLGPFGLSCRLPWRRKRNSR